MKNAFIKRFASIISCLLIVHFSVNLYFGGINYKETLKTKYYSAENEQIIETSHFKILTPKNWIHVFNGYGTEGGARVTFLTGKGMVQY